jgi:glyoxylate/hydroxypyruvate reductase A
VSLLYVHAGDEGALYRDLFARELPELHCIAFPDAAPAGDVAFVACWNPPPGFFAPLAALRAVFALGAGVDRLLARDDLPSSVPIVRLRDAGMAEQMAEYALLGVLMRQRHLVDYRLQQQRAEWRRHPPIARGALRVGVLGLGEMGGAVARTLAALGYAVAGWSRTPKAFDGVDCRHGETGIDALLTRSDVLVNTLPSTAGTRGLLDHGRLSRLPRGAFVVNASRGDQLDAAALRDLLDAGHLSGALLDVFASEPLPADDPLWRHPRVTITPHAAATTLPGPSVRQVADNIRRLLRGEAALGVVERARGY